MKTKAKSVQVFEVRLWSNKHYKGKVGTTKNNIFEGLITDAKSKKKIFFHSVGNFLTAIEKLYLKAEKRG
jgi:hypothetical protein